MNNLIEDDRRFQERVIMDALAIIDAARASARDGFPEDQEQVVNGLLQGGFQPFNIGIVIPDKYRRAAKSYHYLAPDETHQYC